jgi:hypothetical protein
MTKYVSKINSLQKKNKQYEKILKDLRDKELSRHECTNITAMRDKLDDMEKEISLSSIFQRQHESEDSLMSLIVEKAEILENTGFDPTKKNALKYLQEVLSTMYSLGGTANILSSFSPESKTSFKMEEFERDLSAKMKMAQLGAAKSMFGLVTDKSKFIEAGSQTESDPLREILKKRRAEMEELNSKVFTNIVAKLKELENDLEHKQRKLTQMSKSHDEERKRWAARDAELVQSKAETIELKSKYRKFQDLELEMKQKLRKMVQELEEKEESSKQLQIEFDRKLKYFESNEYIISKIEKCIEETKNGGRGKNSLLYESFMRMNVNEEGGENEPEMVKNKGDIEKQKEGTSAQIRKNKKRKSKQFK